LRGYALAGRVGSRAALLTAIGMKIAPVDFVKASLAFIAIFFACHSILWHFYGVTSPLFIYLMKIAGLSSALFLFFNRHRACRFSSLAKLFTGLFVLSFLLALIRPVFAESINLFYFMTDLIGYLTFYVYVLIGMFMANSSFLSDERFFAMMNAFCIVMCSIIIFFYLISGGGKVSTPPDIHYAAVIAVLYGLSRLSAPHLRPQRRAYVLAGIMIVLVGATVSLHKITLLSALAPLVVGVLFMPSATRTRLGLSMRKVRAVAVSVLLAVTVSYLVVAQERFYETYIFSVDLEAGSADDASVQQRVLESILIFRSLADGGLQTMLLGNGFGAVYRNDGLIAHYPEFVHQAHVSPMIVWFRNGVAGLGVLLLTLVIAIKGLRSPDMNVKILGAGLTACLIASLSDLYLYWGFFMGIATGYLLVALERSTSSHRPEAA
jgi:hypothetical protein